MTLEHIEYIAEIFWRAQMLGKVNHIPASDVEKLQKIKERF
jgi:hypothetical protein